MPPDSWHNTHTVKPSPRLDARLVPLRNRVADWLRIEHGTISHLLVTEYLPGTQLGWHRDVPVYETSLVRSLCTVYLITDLIDG